MVKKLFRVTIEGLVVNDNADESVGEERVELYEDVVEISAYSEQHARKLAHDVMKEGRGERIVRVEDVSAAKHRGAFLFKL